MTTIPFRRLLATEMRRCLARRAVHVLIGLAILGIAITAFVGLVTLGPPEVSSTQDPHLAVLADLWQPDEQDGTLLPPISLLAVGALIGGAVIVGGEWKAGTVTTLLTWEVRRARLLAARLLACALLAAAIGVVLLALYVLAAVLPAAAMHGDTSLDGDQLASILGLVARGLVVTSLAATFGAGLASVGRSTTAALVTAFVLEAVIQPSVRGWRPGWSRWLVGENLGAWVSGETLTGDLYTRAPVIAGATLVAYVLGVAAVAAVTFQRRDLAGA